MTNLEEGIFYYLVQGIVSREYKSVEALNKAVEKIKKQRFIKLPIRIVVKEQKVSWFELEEWKKQHYNLGEFKK